VLPLTNAGGYLKKGARRSRKGDAGVQGMLYKSMEDPLLDLAEVLSISCYLNYIFNSQMQ
jgi:hypothetical protein